MIKICNCKRCNHEWAARASNPISCPRCQSKAWDNNIIMPVPAKYPQLCKRCGHEWTTRRDKTQQCPGCHSSYWDLDAAPAKYPITCSRCGKSWAARTPDPTQCRYCHSAYWQSEVKKPILYIKDNRIVGYRCPCGLWYPHRRDRKRQECGDGHTLGGELEIRDVIDGVAVSPRNQDAVKPIKE